MHFLRDHADAADQRNIADVQRSTVDARHRVGGVPPASVEGNMDRRCHRVCRCGLGPSAPPPRVQHRRTVCTGWRILSGRCADVRRLAWNDRADAQDPFYYFLFSTVLVAPFALVDWKPFGVRASIYLLGIGLTLLVGQVFIVLAYRYASAVKVGPFIYTVIVFTALIDWVLWNRAPTLFVLLGMALVIGGGIIAIRKKSEASRQQANGGAEKMASRPER
jgi:hypothetical protein